MPKHLKIFASLLLLAGAFGAGFPGNSIVASIVPAARAAALYSGSAYQTVSVGQDFTIDWFLDTQNQAVNLLDLKLKFDPSLLAAQNAVFGDSVFSVVLKNPQFDNRTGVLALTAGIPNGASGAALHVFRTEFKALKPGNAQIALDPNSALLLNNAQGSPTALNFVPLQFVIAPEVAGSATAVSSPTNPDQNAWYKNRNVEITYKKDPGTIYSASFSSNIEIYPPDQAAAQNDLHYDNLPDGIYYFKLNAQTGPSTWREAAVYKVQIDATAPEPFAPAISSDPATFNGQPFLSFNTVDKTSGISHYEVKVGTFGKFRPAVSPILIKRPLVGDNILVQAVDNAGNIRTESITFKGDLSARALTILLAIILFILVAAINLYYWRRVQIRKQK